MPTYPPARIELFRPAIGEEEIEAVAAVMRSGWIGRGPVCDQFEAAFAARLGVTREHVLAVSCATEGLHQIMAWLAAWPAAAHKHAVILPSISYIGTAAAVLEAGLAVQLCDVDSRSLNPSAGDFLDVVSPQASAVVFQHYGGFAGGGYELRQMCDLWEVPLIEDFACHPLGRPAGDFGVWSFDAMKVMTAADGGMIYCRDAGVAQQLREWTRLGMSSESGKQNQSERWWEFTAVTPGRRSIMNDLQAAIGLVQLDKLEQMVQRRAMLWDAYQAELPNAEWLGKPYEPGLGARAESSYYTYWVQLPHTGARDRLARCLRERGIYTSFRYWPIHRAYGWEADCAGADWAADHTLNLPLHPGLSDGDVAYICESIAEFGKTL